ncbi:MAG: beta-lactamase family protein [Ardenticatenales bacterium]|nr:beta-lactamase family protein [Ardenticatenales bacterium]
MAELNLANALAESGAPAMAALVLAHDRILAQGVAGLRQQGQPEPLRLTDPIHIGSNAKAMTATLVASLIHSGQLSWDSKPVDLLPQLAGQFHPALAEITLEQLLRHTAGLAPFTEEEEIKGLPEFTGTPRQQRLAFSRWLLAREPHLEPDTAFSYSNAGYAVVAASLEAHLDEAWDVLLHQHLFAPLGITAGIGWPGLHGQEAPWGHMAATDEASLEPVDPVHHEYRLPAILAPAGDIHLSLPDYGKFLQMNLRALQGRDTILPAAAIRYLHEPAQGIGLGWGVQQFLGHTASVHAGGAGTFIIVGFVLHDQDLAAAVVANAGTDRAERAVVNQLKSILQTFSS